MRPMKVRLGEILVNGGLISEQELHEFLAKAKLTGKKLGKVLVDAKRLPETAIIQALANQLGIPFIDLNKQAISSKAALSLPETFARRWGCLVIEKIESSPAIFKVAMADPADVYLFDEINKQLDGEINIVAATEDAIYTAIDRIYRKTDEIDELAEALTREFSETRQDTLDFAQMGASAGEDAPVVKLLQSIFEDAIARRASDIHIEPMDRKLLVRIRVDGTLHLLSESDSKTAAPLAQRLKLLSGLDITERRMPQDGRFNIKVHRHIIDVRIATSPTAFGECVVMRLLNQNASHVNLDSLGMPVETQMAFMQALERPQGMILVTGPTGSGKTTTLYSALTRLNSTEIKIITVEDPIEYRISGINQIQTHEKIGLTFNTALRSILRQDPDVILVGEMRDSETVEAAMRASMTGHMVLSTLHTNDAKSAPSRLIDLGAEAFVVGQSLQLVLAQRLVRLVCTHCAKNYEPTAAELLWSAKFTKHEQHPTFKMGDGCDQCAHTGYLGRSAVYEHLTLSKELISMLSMSNQKFIDAAELSMKNRTLSHHANELARNGIITLREARRVSYEV